MRLVSSCTGLGLFGAGLLVSVAASFVAALADHAVTARIGGRRAGSAASRPLGLCGRIAWSGRATGVSLRRPRSLGLLRRHAPPLDHRRHPDLCHGSHSSDGHRADRGAHRRGAAGRHRQRREVRRWGDAPGPDGKRRRIKALRPLVAVAIAPLGLFGYLGWVGYRMGDYSGYFKLQEGAWAHTFDYGKHTLDVFTSLPVGHFDYLFAYPYEDLIGVGTVLLALIVLPLLFRLLPAVLVVHTLLTIALVLGSQQIFGNISRYLLPAFPLVHPVRRRPAAAQHAGAVHRPRESPRSPPALTRGTPCSNSAFHNRRRHPCSAIAIPRYRYRYRFRRRERGAAVVQEVVRVLRRPGWRRRAVRAACRLAAGECAEVVVHLGEGAGAEHRQEPLAQHPGEGDRHGRQTGPAAIPVTASRACRREAGSRDGGRLPVSGCARGGSTRSR